MFWCSTFFDFFLKMAADTIDEVKKLSCLVADSAAFIRNVDLETLTERVFTIHEVISEIRDSATRKRLAVLPYEVEFREPSAESIKTSKAIFFLLFTMVLKF